MNIVGHFAPPVATALDCTTVSMTASAIAPGQRSFGTATCRADYTPTGGGVGFSNNPIGINMNASYQNGSGWFTLSTNGSTDTLTITHTANCCREPGR